MPALLGEAGVKECLSAVIRDQQLKAAFVLALQTNLCAYAGRSSDSITELRRRIRELRDTLSFRLPLLSHERRGAWFREYAYRGLGPFPTSILTEPVFAPFEPEQTAALKAALADSFRKRIVSNLPFSPGGPCLWLSLLTVNQALAQVSVLPAPFRTYRLDAGPAELPSALESAAIQSFLLSIRDAFAIAKQELGQVFEQLWAASCPFWEHDRRSSETQAGASRASEMRSQFRARRQTIGHKPSPKVSLSDLNALRFMNLREMPSKLELRQRYLELARKFHPDCDGGNEDHFKLLTKAYSHLAQRLREAV